MPWQIHFYESNTGSNLITSWQETESAFLARRPVICTTQMGFLSLHAWLFEAGYRIFVHEEDGSSYEIKLGGSNERTNRELRIGHNIFKLWLSGEFIKREGRNQHVVQESSMSGL